MTEEVSEFVFLDNLPWPWLVRKDSDGWWLYTWFDNNKNFVSVRKLVIEEVERFRLHALSPEVAAFYRKEIKCQEQTEKSDPK